MNVIDAILALYKSEINCGISTFWDGGVDVWIGDDVNGIKAGACFDESEVASCSGSNIAVWLMEQASILYPESQHAKHMKPTSFVNDGQVPTRPFISITVE